MNNFTIDLAGKTETLISKSILRINKQKMMLENVEMKSNAPKKTRKQNSYVIQMSDGTIKRYRDDVILDSPYNRIKFRKKNNQSKSTITQSQTPTTSENNKKNLKKRKSIKKSDLREKVDNVRDFHSSEG